MSDLNESIPVFRRAAEVCPRCGAIDSFRKGTAGWQYRPSSGDRITRVSCKECGLRAIRWVEMPKDAIKTPQ